MSPSPRQRRTTMPNTPLAKLQGDAAAADAGFEQQTEDEISGVSRSLSPELLAEILAKTTTPTH